MRKGRWPMAPALIWSPDVTVPSESADRQPHRTGRRLLGRLLVACRFNLRGRGVQLSCCLVNRRGRFSNLFGSCGFGNSLDLRDSHFQLLGRRFELGDRLLEKRLGLGFGLSGLVGYI